MGELSPDIAQKALDADVRNTLHEVAQGGTLPPSKRQLMLDIVAGASSPEGIIISRETALLRKFAQGGRLKREEMEEIAHLMPVQPLGTRLRDEVYKRTYIEYEPIYDKKKRTIQSWVDVGKAASGGPDLPPLDCPRDMPVWWKRNMKQRCPPGVEAAARRDIGEVQPSAPRQSVPPVSSGFVPGNNASDSEDAGSPLSEETADFETRLKHVKQQRDRAYNALLAAQQAKAGERSEGVITALMKDWRELDEAASKAEAKAVEYRAKMGRYVDAEELSANLGPMLVAVASGVRSLWHRLKSKLRNATDESEEDALWQAGIDETFEEIESSGYAEAFKLQP